jgi:site-specific recombinase XerD
MDLSEAIKEFDLAHRGVTAERTRQAYRDRLRYLAEHFGGERDVASITSRELRDWRGTMVDQEQRWEGHPSRPVQAGPLSPVTINGRIQAARRLFSWLVGEGVLSESPAVKLSKVKEGERVPKAVTPEDRLLLLKAAREHPRDYALCRLLADTGLRVGELCSLRISDMNFQRQEALVMGKGQKLRAIFWNDRTNEALRAWMMSREDDNPYLFPGARDGAGLTPQGVHRALKRLALAAGIQGRYNPHAFRHGLAQAMLEEDSDMGLVADVLGHRQIETTFQHYAVFARSDVGRRKRGKTPEFED